MLTVVIAGRRVIRDDDVGTQFANLQNHAT
jgi:hypothetical protein